MMIMRNKIMNKTKIKENDIQKMILNEIEKQTSIKNYDIEKNLFDPNYDNSINPVDLVYIFSKVFEKLSISIEDVLTNYSFNNFTIKGISELIIEKIG